MKSVSVGLFQHRNGTFYTIRRTGEKQQWRSLGTTDKTEALRKLVFQLDVSPAQPEQDFPSFKDIAELWISSIKHTIKPTTYEWRSWCLQHLFLKFGKQSIDKIPPADIESWMHWRLEHASPSTAWRNLNPGSKRCANTPSKHDMIKSPESCAVRKNLCTSSSTPSLGLLYGVRKSFTLAIL
ncbi:MAG: hypothetical protein WCS94_00015 [Verrucomicrobiota bacterium]